MGVKPRVNPQDLCSFCRMLGHARGCAKVSLESAVTDVDPVLGGTSAVWRPFRLARRGRGDPAGPRSAPRAAPVTGLPKDEWRLGKMGMARSRRRISAFSCSTPFVVPYASNSCKTAPCGPRLDSSRDKQFRSSAFWRPTRQVSRSLNSSRLTPFGIPASGCLATHPTTVSDYRPCRRQCHQCPATRSNA